ncbi:MAG: glycosyltransferase family 2 protein [Thermodesulfobacteriota bacterium]
MTTNLSLILPVHNEGAILERNVTVLSDYLRHLDGLDSYEILLVLNGCTDGSEGISKALSISRPEITHMSIKERGLGGAILKGVEAAAYDMVMFYAVDLPFGLSVIGDSIKSHSAAPGAVIIGSKGHGGSVVERGFMRSLFSLTISALNNFFFGLGVKDTQGSILFHRKPLRRFMRFMDSPGAFFQTQILIYSKLAGLKLIEIPVTLKKGERKTRFNLAGDGYRYVRSIFREAGRIRRLGRGGLSGKK